MTTTRDDPSAARLVVAALATFRLTRIVTQDYITEDLREQLKRKLPEKPAYLIGCPWCASFWLAPLVALALVLFPRSRVLNVALLSLAGSAVSGLLANMDPAPDLGIRVEGDVHVDLPDAKVVGQ